MAKTVMIVEDNELNMKLFRDLIEAHGYRTVQTRSGLSAMEIAREHRPDLILMDIQLPEISGLDVTRKLKADSELKSIPVIAVTALMWPRFSATRTTATGAIMLIAVQSNCGVVKFGIPNQAAAPTRPKSMPGTTPAPLPKTSTSR